MRCIFTVRVAEIDGYIEGDPELAGLDDPCFRISCQSSRASHLVDFGESVQGHDALLVMKVKEKQLSTVGSLKF